MTLDEYVRKRKIQYAVKELIDTDHRVIDIAMKHGYASATAFSRAVRNFMGNTPSKIRKEGFSVCFTVDCVDPENEAWEQMSEWCKKNVPDRIARRYVRVASSGHYPRGVGHQNASEHVMRPYKAMMYLVGDECNQEEFYGLKVEDALSGLFLVNDVALNQFDENNNLDIALSMMKASGAFVCGCQLSRSKE